MLTQAIKRVSALLLCAAFAAPAWGQATMDWVGADPGGSDWYLPSNWNLGSPPASIDNLSIVNSLAPQMPTAVFVDIDLAGAVRFQNAGVTGALGDLTIGLTGGTPSLTAIDGALVDLTSLMMAADAAVTDAQLYIGNTGSVDVLGGPSVIGQSGTATMNIVEGGLCSGVDATLGQFATGGGAVTVHGDGSQWLLGDVLIVGESGTGQLDVQAGGAVIADWLRSGVLAGSSGQIGVDGWGAGGASTLSVTHNATIGQSGYATTASVTGGGAFEVGGTLSIGQGSAAVSSSLTVRGDDGAGHVSSLTSGNLTVGNSTSANFIVDQGATASTLDTRLGANTGSAGYADVANPDTRWTTNGHLLSVGSGGFGSLSVTDGAEVLSGTPTIGHDSSAGNSGAVVDGHDSRWAATGDYLAVGYHASDCSLEVTGGGRLETNGAKIGEFDVANNNSVLVGGQSATDGTPSTWDARGDAFIVGDAGSGNALLVDNGARLYTDAATIGRQTGAIDNEVTIDGADTMWDLSGNDLSVGYQGGGTLEITNGAQVYAGFTEIGWSSAADAGVTVSHVNSLLDLNGQDLYVGNGANGQMTINDGATVQNIDDVVVAGSASSSDAQLSVGVGASTSTLDITNGFSVGAYGNGTFYLRNYGQVDCEDSSLGIGASGSGAAEVYGANAHWNVADDLWVGSRGQGELTVTLGDVTVGDELHIGTASSSITVNGGNLTFGKFGNPWEGTFNFTSGTVRVTNGNVVIDSTAPLGSYYSLNEDMTLVVDQALLIESQSSFSVNSGGLLQAAEVRNDGYLSIYANGVVELIDPGGELRNDKMMDMSKGLITGPGTFVNRFAGQFYGYGTFDCDVVNYGQFMVTENSDAMHETTNYGLFQMGEEYFEGPFTANVSYRSHGVFANHGHVILGNALDGTGSLVNQVNGVIETGYGPLHGISPPTTNRGLIHATTYEEMMDPYYYPEMEGGSRDMGPGILPTTLIIEDLSGGNLDGGVLAVDDGCTINVLAGFLSEGMIRLDGPDATFLTDGIINNAGSIAGQGRIGGAIANNGAVNVDDNAALLVTAAFSNHPAGVVDIGQGSSFVCTQGMTPNQGGIIMHDSALNTGGETLTNDTAGYITGSGVIYTPYLVNDGHVGVGPGGMDVDGALTNNGAFDVRGGETLTVYGPTDGAGAFTGLGTVVLLGNVSPGASPGSLSFGGDLVLGGSTLYMELGGDDPTSEYDQLIVVGNITLAGVLEVLLYDGWTPAAGDVYDLIEFGSITGSFTDVILPELTGGLTWDDSALYSTGSITVVPEPNAFVLLGFGGLMYAYRRRA